MFFLCFCFARFVFLIFVLAQKTYFRCFFCVFFVWNKILCVCYSSHGPCPEQEKQEDRYLPIKIQISFWPHPDHPPPSGTVFCVWIHSCLLPPFVLVCVKEKLDSEKEKRKNSVRKCLLLVCFVLVSCRKNCFFLSFFTKQSKCEATAILTAIAIGIVGV